MTRTIPHPAATPRWALRSSSGIPQSSTTGFPELPFEKDTRIAKQPFPDDRSLFRYQTAPIPFHSSNTDFASIDARAIIKSKLGREPTGALKSLTEDRIELIYHIRRSKYPGVSIVVGVCENGKSAYVRTYGPIHPDHTFDHVAEKAYKAISELANALR